MRIKKSTLVRIIVFLLIVSVVLTGCGRNNMDFDFAKIFANEYLDDLSLTIYYINPFTFISFGAPLSGEDLIDIRDEKIVIYGNELKKSIELFKQINSDILRPASGRQDEPHIRLYYVLESRVNGRLIDVVMWGRRDGIIFNGVEVEEHYIFYDIVLPFLPESIAELFEVFRDRSIK